MIEMHRLNGEPFWVNHNLIETMEKTPDTVLRLTTENRYIVKESIEEVVEKIVQFNRRIFTHRNHPNLEYRDSEKEA